MFKIRSKSSYRKHNMHKRTTFPELDKTKTKTAWLVVVVWWY